MQKDFTKQAAKVLETARALAKKWNHPYVGTEHLLLALRREFTGVAGQILAANKVEEEKITKVIEELISPELRCRRREHWSSARDWYIFWIMRFWKQCDYLLRR